MKEKIIIGIDPGTNVMGYGILQYSSGKLIVLQYGVLHLGSYDNQALKLQKIFEQTSKIIEEYSPDELAIEEPFYGKNPQSMLKLGRAQGVAMIAALSKGIPVVEYAPKKVKKSVAGNGNASKLQVAGVLSKILNITTSPDNLLDATDALSLAVCHAYQKSGMENGGGKAKSWAAFVKDNPKRIK
jgi:crossover junction endodeoxyribonuclease RuvC